MKQIFAAIKKAKEDNDADYQAKLAAYQTELARVQKANADAKAAYERLLKKTLLRTMLSKLKMKLLNNENETAKATYELNQHNTKKDLAAVKTSEMQLTKQDYQTKLAAYQTELARVQKANADAKAAYEKAVEEKHS